jgi:site-specific DNA-methyltransferase (adenine-specific)/modification methylase
LGDCLEILPTLGKVDAVVTDPPYGVGLDYGSFEDTPDYVLDVAVEMVKHSIIQGWRIALTPGNKNAWLYPKPDDIGAWFNPAGTVFGRWGFILAHLILYYGKEPRPHKSASSVTGLFDHRDVKEDHPCIKPLQFMTWLVNKASDVGEVVLDPFMGSGTTGVACANLGRKFIGIEIDPKYFDIACRRVSYDYKQPRLFEDESPEFKQGKLL